jgi:hypothetical protein
MKAAMAVIQIVLHYRDVDNMRSRTAARIGRSSLACSLHGVLDNAAASVTQPVLPKLRTGDRSTGRDRQEPLAACTITKKCEKL